MKPKYDEMMELEWFGLLKVMFYFPDGKSTMTGESISESFWVFLGTLQQIQDNMGMIIHTSDNHG